jgi:hypothetical protein
MDSNTFFSYLNSAFLVSFAKSTIEFAWGSNDTTSVMIAKRTFLMLPTLGLIGAYWATLVGFASIIVRSKRQKFVQTLMLTWWDLGKSIFNFGSGIFKFAMTAGFTAFGLVRIATLGLWSLCLDVFSLPFKALASIGKGIANPSLPWIAVSLTFKWSCNESENTRFEYTPHERERYRNPRQR